MLNYFKWYRKLRGGIWYKNYIESYTFEDGIASLYSYYEWSREALNVVETEDY